MPFKTVVVLSRDGRESWIGTLDAWHRDDFGQWIAHVMVYGPRHPDRGTGMYRDALLAHRVLPLEICGRLPSGEILHGDDCGPATSVMLPT